MADDLAERMRRARVEDLILMARDRPEDGISPEAVVAARAELVARDLPVEDIEERSENLDAWQAEDTAEADRRLSISSRILFGMFGFTFFGIIAGFVMRAQGRRQAADDAIVAALIGAAAVWGLGLVSVLASAAGG